MEGQTRVIEPSFWGLHSLPFLPRPGSWGVALSEAAMLSAPGQPCGYLKGGAVVSPFLDFLGSRHLTTAQMFGFQSPCCPDCSPHNTSRLAPRPLASVTPRADSEVCRQRLWSWQLCPSSSGLPLSLVVAAAQHPSPAVYKPLFSSASRDLVPDPLHP